MLELANESPLPFVALYLTGGEEFAVVDRDLFPRLIEERWYLHKARKCLYVRSWSARHARTYLHHAVQRLLKRRRPSPNHVVRHLNGNTFDCRGSNLRWGTRTTNSRCAPYVERRT